MKRDVLQVEVDNSSNDRVADADTMAADTAVADIAGTVAEARMAQALCTACIEELRNAGVQPAIASAVLIRQGAQIALCFGTPAGVAGQLRKLAELAEAGALSMPIASNSRH